MKKTILVVMLSFLLALPCGCRKVGNKNSTIEKEIPIQEVDAVELVDTSEFKESGEPLASTMDTTETTEKFVPHEYQPEENSEDDPWSLGSFSEDDFENGEQPAQVATKKDPESVTDTSELRGETTEATEADGGTPAETETATEEDFWDAGAF